MAHKRHSKEQVLQKLSEANAAIKAGKTIPEVSRALGVSEATLHRWRKRQRVARPRASAAERRSAGPVDLRNRVRQLERENERLKLLVGELSLENALLKDAAAR